VEETKYKYKSWPLGKLPKDFQRPELDNIRDLGYQWNDPRDVVSIFENKVAEFAGAKYAVAVDCCSNGIFLCLKYLQTTGEINSDTVITIPNRTYVSVPMQIKHAGCALSFRDYEWSGQYNLQGTRIWDAAVRWNKGMFVGEDALQVVSFQLKKRVPIGRGGMVITNDKEAADWIRLASYDGRDLTTDYTDPNHFRMLGYHMYMTPEDAARGIILMDKVPEDNDDSGNHLSYTDLTTLTIF
jgi:dTDP-4-amino-4,6-dideoxygalactose transaminase